MRGTSWRPHRCRAATHPLNLHLQAAGKGVQATAQLVTTLTSLMATDLWITGLHAAPNVTVRDSMNASAAKGCGADAPSGESNEYAYTRWTQDVSVTQQSMPEELDRAGRRRRLHAAADHTASASSQLAHRRLQAGRAADSLAAHIRATASPAEQQLAAQAVKRHLLECTDASAAIVTLIMSLQGLQADSNYVQNQVLACSTFCMHTASAASMRGHDGPTGICLWLLIVLLIMLLVCAMSA